MVDDTWLLIGNKSTDPLKNFIGTTDKIPLILRANGVEAIRINEVGNIGIGMTNPGRKLDVCGYNMLTDPNAKYNSHFPDSNNCAYVTGNRIILRGGEPEEWKEWLNVDSANSRLDVHAYNMLTDPNEKYNSHFPDTNNCAYVTGNRIILRGGEPEGWKECLTVDSASGNVEVAGDIILQNADCAEDFEVLEAETVDAGTVMTLKNGGQLEQSTQPYDKRVAGVVSGAGDLKPGLVLGRQAGHTNKLPIALIGKVHCKVDAEYSPIEVGDLLTTSYTHGYAMKADDPLKAFGAVIGKALASLGEGTGLIPILVALQ